MSAHKPAAAARPDRQKDADKANAKARAPAQSPSQPGPGAASSAAHAQRSQGRLLILDDDANVGKMIQLIAETSGLAARFMTEPAAFFRAVDEWQPSHIALDLLMPEMDGVQVLGELAERQCRARIIITSGVGTRVLEAAGRSAAERGLDIVGVLAKPFSPAALRGMLGPGQARPVRAPASPAPSGPQAQSFVATEAALREAMGQNQLWVAYQPKIACPTGRLAGFEALVRWSHPVHGLVMPDQFIPFAEQHDLIDALTECVLQRALAWLATAYPGRAEDAPTLSVNISARTLKDPAFVERLLESCHDHGVAPERLAFELTETSAMEDPVTSLDLLTRMRMKGFRLSIDDFGTGFSSMLQLVRLPFSEIKVDKSFVMTASRSQESRAVIRSIVDLGRSLGLTSTAEGVEDAETLAYLTEIGCDLAQGYYIARPMPGTAVRAWAASRPA